VKLKTDYTILVKMILLKYHRR